MKVDAVVIGAGLCGLTAAYRLAQIDTSVLLIEKSEAVGGVIQSFEHEGFLLEAGPNTFPSKGQSVLSLCHSLGLETVAASPLARNRYIYHQGALHDVPLNPARLMSSGLLSLTGKTRLFLEPFQPKGKELEESVAEFACRRIGAEALEVLLGPFLSGVYAGDPEKLSYRAVFPKLFVWEQQAGSILKGALRSRLVNPGKESKPKMPYLLYSFSRGMGTLPKALAEALPNGVLRLKTIVQSLRLEDTQVHLTLSDGESVICKALLLATPAPVTAELLKPVAPDISEILADIQYAPLAVVHLGFERDAIAHSLDGFGVLCTRATNSPLLGTIWSSSLFPDRAPKGQVLLSSFVGGALYPERAFMDEPALIENALTGLRQIFKQPDLKPTMARVVRYEQAIPQYNLGHTDRVAALVSGLQAYPGVFVAGNYLNGVSVNDCVQEGNRAAMDIKIFLNTAIGLGLSQSLMQQILDHP